MGLLHVGDDADQAGGIETMNTCRSAADRRASGITSDEWGSWLYHNSSQGDNDVLPNPGFEKGGAAWAKEGNIYVLERSTGGRSGPRNFRLRDDAPGSFRSAMFVSDGARSDINVEIWVRALSGSSQSGSIRIQSYFIPRIFGPDGCGTYPSGRNENNTTSNGTARLLTSNSRKAVSSGWRQIQSASVEAPANSGIILIVVTTSQEYVSSGNPASVYIDDVSVRAN